MTLVQLPHERLEEPPPSTREQRFRVKSARFGEVSVRREDVFEFHHGIPGFPGRSTIVLFPNPAGGCFEWLHSPKTPALCLAVIEPDGALGALLGPHLGRAIRQLGWDVLDDIQARLIVTVPAGAPHRTTVNVRAPVVLNRTRGEGAQPILHDETLPLRMLLFPQPEDSTQR